MSKDLNEVNRKVLNLINLGAGVDSSTLALKAAHGGEGSWLHRGDGELPTVPYYGSRFGREGPRVGNPTDRGPTPMVSADCYAR